MLVEVARVVDVVFATGPPGVRVLRVLSAAVVEDSVGELLFVNSTSKTRG